MAMAVERNVVIEEQGQSRAGGVWRVTTFDNKDRTQRALRKLALFWLVALICVAIPIAHFFLVPGFFAAGIAVAVLTFKQDEATVELHGECPHCHEQVEFAMEATDKLPKWTYCPKCDTSVQLISE